MKILFDTNVYVSEALLGKTASRIIDATQRADWRIFVSTYLLDEVERVIADKLGFSRRLATLSRQPNSADAPRQRVPLCLFEQWRSVIDDYVRVVQAEPDHSGKRVCPTPTIGKGWATNCYQEDGLHSPSARRCQPPSWEPFLQECRPSRRAVGAAARGRNRRVPPTIRLP